MINVTRLNNAKIVINAEMIQSLHSAPDTVITFTNNDRLMVREQVEEVSDRIMAYRQSVSNNLPYLACSRPRKREYLV